MSLMKMIRSSRSRVEVVTPGSVSPFLQMTHFIFYSLPLPDIHEVARYGGGGGHLWAD